MKKIPLTQGKFALVDDEDYEYLMQWKWCILNQKGRYYARRTDYSSGVQKSVSMHRLIMKATDAVHVDHKNHNTLDNRKSQLRICTQSENNRNVKSYRGVSAYKGVSWHKRRKKWQANIQIEKYAAHLGYFDEEEDAAIMYNTAAQLLFGEFAYLNKLT